MDEHVPQTVVVLPELDELTAGIFNVWLGQYLHEKGLPGASLVSYKNEEVQFPWDDTHIQSLGPGSTVIMVFTDMATQYLPLTDAYEALIKRGCQLVELVEFQINISTHLSFVAAKQEV